MQSNELISKAQNRETCKMPRGQYGTGISTASYTKNNGESLTAIPAASLLRTSIKLYIFH